MKQSNFFLAIIATYLVTVACLEEAKTSSLNHSKQSNGIDKQVLIYGVSPIDLPITNGDSDSPEVKTSVSCNTLLSSSYIQISQEIFCLFEIVFEVKEFNPYHSPLPVTLNSFYRNLLRIIISPNAP